MGRYRGGNALRSLTPGRTPHRKWEHASPEAKEGFEYGPGPLCLSGGFTAGKTINATRKALYLSDLFPGNRGIIARGVWDKLKKTTMATFFKDCPPEAYRYGRRSDQDKILQFNPRKCADGVVRQSEILWLYLDDPDAEAILRGLEINWFIIDQAEEVEEEMFDILLRRLGRWDRAFVPPEVMLAEKAAGREWKWWNKQGLPIPPTYPIITCNPDTELHWIYRRFHPESDEWKEHYRQLGYKMVEMSPLGNKFLTDQNKEQLLTADESWKRRFVYGKWGIVEGLIHHIHPSSIIEGTPDILKWLHDNCVTWYRVLDHGDTSPTAVLWAGALADGITIVFREYYQPDKLISDHRMRIWELSAEDGPDIVRKYQNLADPSIFYKTAQRQGGKYSVSNEYTDTEMLDARTAIWWRPADNNEMGTRNRINEYLRFDPEKINPFTREKGSPNLFFIQRTPEYPNGCYHVVKETRVQRREKKGTMDGHPVFTDDRDETIPDHAHDDLRYLIAARPPIRRMAPQRGPKLWTLDDLYRMESRDPARDLYVPVPLPRAR